MVSDGLPDGLDEMEPGPELAALLARVDIEELSGYDRVVVVGACQRMVSHYSAGVYEGIAGVYDSLEEELDADVAVASDAAAAELRAALCLTRRSAERELELALGLWRRLPRVWEALARGLIDKPRARVFVDATAHLSVGTAREVVDRLMERARGMTTGQLGALIRRLCIEVDPEDAQRRYCRAMTGRRVLAEPTCDGTSNLLGLDLPPHRVAAVTHRINQIARSLKSRGESRTMDQLRADVFLDLLEGSQAGGGGSVDIRVDLDTLIRLSEDPGELAGYGPVIADIARQVTDEQSRARWRYAITDSHTGQVVHTGITRRRPTTTQQRRVEATYPTCVFPGCRMPSVSCDLDHRVPYAEGGATTPANLAPLCRHDHRIRHQAGWAHQLGDGGSHQWASPLGHTYTSSGTPP